MIKIKLSVKLKIKKIYNCLLKLDHFLNKKDTLNPRYLFFRSLKKFIHIFHILVNYYSISSTSFHEYLFHSSV